MSRDVFEAERNKKPFSVWEIPIYIGLLVLMLIAQVCITG
jgi:hypothetical protein